MIAMIQHMLLRLYLVVGVAPWAAYSIALEESHHLWVWGLQTCANNAAPLSTTVYRLCCRLPDP